jgi:hypothetical protein
MPIEIKELVVKFNVTESETPHKKNGSNALSNINYNKLIRDCTNKVLRELNRKKER